MRNAVIAATGAYLPKIILPNSYFNELLGEDVDTWLTNNLQIYERRWCAEEESTVDLCEHAANQAIERAGIRARDIDLIIVATDTPEYLSPATSAIVQYRLQAGHAGTFDLNTACAGFLTGLDVGAKYIRTDERYNYVLVIGAYAMSKYLDKADKKTVTLFADGAGAIILKAENDTDRGYLAGELMTLGQYYDGMGIYGGGTKNPISHDVINRKEHFLKINYRFPPELNPQMWTHLSKNLLAQLNMEASEVNHYFLTQININSIHKTLDNLNLPHEKAHTAMKYYGYTGSACIPIALNDAVEKGKVKENDTLFMIGSGSGLVFGGLAFRY